jgi:hypothetical protein
MRSVTWEEYLSSAGAAVMEISVEPIQPMKNNYRFLRSRWSVAMTGLFGATGREEKQLQVPPLPLVGRNDRVFWAVRWSLGMTGFFGYFG